MKKMLAASVALFALSPVAAQNLTPGATPQPATSAVLLAPTNENVLRTGVPVVLKMSEELNTGRKDLRTGYHFQMEVAEPVMVGSQIVIPAGTPVTGEVTHVKNTGMWGKAGAINARVLYARLGGRQIRMSGAFDDKGKSGTVGVVASVAFLPVAGFFVKGKNAVIPMGATFGGFMDEDVSFVPGASTAPAPAPLQAVAAPAASAPVATPASLKN